jgi:cell division protein FtsB
VGLLSFFASVPVAANLKLRLLDCEKQCGVLTAELEKLKAKNAVLEKRVAEQQQRNAALEKALNDCCDGRGHQAHARPPGPPVREW